MNLSLHGVVVEQRLHSLRSKCSVLSRHKWSPTTTSLVGPSMADFVTIDGSARPSMAAWMAHFAASGLPWVLLNTYKIPWIDAGLSKLLNGCRLETTLAGFYHMIWKSLIVITESSPYIMCIVVQTSMKEEKEDGLMEDAVLYQVYGEPSVAGVATYGTI